MSKSIIEKLVDDNKLSGELNISTNKNVDDYIKKLKIEIIQKDKEINKLKRIIDILIKE